MLAKPFMVSEALPSIVNEFVSLDVFTTLKTFPEFPLAAYKVKVQADAVETVITSSGVGHLWPFVHHRSVILLT